MNCHGDRMGTGPNRDTNSACCGGGGGAGRFPWIAVLLIGALVLAAVFAKAAGAGWIGDMFRKSPADIGKSAGVVETAGEVRIPRKAFDAGKAIFLKADIAGKEIHYFALKSGDGVYRAAFDACDVCFRKNRGYRQEGDLMVCNNCGQSFPSAKVNDIKGGCNPSPLARTVDGEHLVIRKSDLAAGGTYFAGRRM